MADVETHQYRFIVTPQGAIEALFVGRKDADWPSAEYVTDDRLVGNLLLLSIAERLDRLIDERIASRSTI